MNKIYIIFDKSYQWGDQTNDSEIKYVSTNKERAEAYFVSNYGDTVNKDDSKWCYCYELWEYPDGYDYWETIGYPAEFKKKHLIKHIDNLRD